MCTIKINAHTIRRAQTHHHMFTLRRAAAGMRWNVRRTRTDLIFRCSSNFIEHALTLHFTCTTIRHTCSAIDSWRTFETFSGSAFSLATLCYRRKMREIIVFIYDFVFM